MKKPLIVSLAALMTACGFFASTPGKVAAKYFDALSKEKYGAAYEHLSSRDRAVKNLEAFTAENTAGANPVMSTPAGRPVIDIQEPEIEADKARVRVTITPAGLAAGAPPPAPQIIRLIKEGNDWKLFLGWEAQSLVAEARRLQESGKLAEALEAFEKALKADPDSVDASDGQMQVDRLIHTRQLATSYMENNVEVIDLKVTRGGGRAGASVSGKILNNGHRTLSQVDIGIYFLAADGKVIAERSYRPIPSSDVTYYGEDRTLRRGGVKEFGYIVEGALPKAWTGKARALVTGIEFEEST